MFVTVFTPAYNRANTLHRVYDSLRQQTYKNFEWIIIDDGSKDNTREVVERFLQEDNFFEIRYFHQTNRGKHIATNEAVNKAKGEMFICLDSDDACKANAIEVLIDAWNTIPEDKKEGYKGVACRTCDPKTPDRVIGTIGDMWMKGKYDYFDSNDTELRFIHKIKGELWGMTRVEILKKYQQPNIEGLHYFPEGINWCNIGFEYATRYINFPLRYYYRDDENAITKKINSKESYYTREWVLTTLVKKGYFKYEPRYFLRNAVGLFRDGILSGRSINQLFKVPDTFLAYLLSIVAMPFGIYLASKEKKKRKS